MIGIHYSRVVQTSLDSSRYGTGNPCAARHRVAGHDVLSHRIHFYVARDGVPVIPERACGPYRHAADLSDLRIYRLSDDPLALRDKVREMHPADQSARVNALELAVVGAGFDGYLADFGQCDAVVLLGRRTISVAHSPKG